jgi:clorobiocin biosynthesis protein CloN4
VSPDRVDPHPGSPHPGSLHRAVRDAAARTPGAPAVTGPAGTATYAELDRHADALAWALAERGVGRGDRVVVRAAKSPAAVAATQAALRVGACYVPVAASAPPERAAALAADCAAAAVVADPGGAAPLRALLGPGTPVLGTAAPDAPPGPFPDPGTGPGDLAYVLYTSGSTGRPKGVRITHGAARAFVDWAVRELGVGPGDRLANHAAFTFDLSVLDLYAAFTAGAAVSLVPEDAAFAPALLVDHLHRERVTVWYSVPSALALMMRDGGLLDRPAPPHLRAVLFAGEPFPIAPLRDLAGWTGARLLNLYGPTETNVCTFHEVRPEDLRRDAPVPIGRAACGDRVRAVRPDGAAAGPGETGELVVEGPTVMRGYWGAPDLEGPYRTGDLVRVRADGAFDFLGRRDRMLKVRGYRIEAGEVESVLATHPEVAEAAVVVHGAGLDAALAAFVVPVPGARPGVLSLKRHSAQRLPPYMVVDRVRLVAELPRTGNGKVDRDALTAAG